MSRADRKSYICPLCGAINTVMRPSHMTPKSFKQGLPKTVICCMNDCAGVATPVELALKQAVAA